MTDQTYTGAISSQMKPALQAAIRLGDPGIAKELTYFIRDSLFLAVRYADRTMYDAYLDLPEFIYQSINQHRDDGESIPTLFAPFRVTVPSGIMRDLLGTAMYNLGSDLDDPITFSEGQYFYYNAFIKFNSFLRSTIVRNDQSSFTTIKVDFDKAFRTAMFYKGQAEKTAKEAAEEGEVDTNEVIKARAIDLVYDNIQEYYRRSLVGLRYWSNYLFYRGVINEQAFRFFAERTRFITGNSIDRINDLLFVTSGDNENYLDWSTWNVPVPEGQFPGETAAPSHWMRVGFMMDILFHGSFYLNVEEQDTENTEKLLLLADHLEEFGEELLQEHEKWHQFFDVQSRSGLRQRIIEALSPITQLRPFEFPEFEDDIVSSSLSEERINSFKARAGEAWQRQSRMRELFERLGNVAEIPTLGKKLVTAGGRTLLKNAKASFIDDERTIKVYGTEDIAAQVGRTEDELLFKRIAESNHSVIVGDESTQILDEAIALLNERQIKPSMILTHPEFSYKDETLLNSKNFKGHLNLINDGQPFQAFHIGEYKGLPIYTAFCEFLADRFVVCDLKKAFTLEYKSNKDWYDKLLNLDIRELTRDEIVERLADKTKDWGVALNGTPQTREQAYTMLRSSVFFDAWTLLDFKIDNASAFVEAKLIDTPDDDL